MEDELHQPPSEPPRIIVPPTPQIIVPGGRVGLVDDSLEKILEGEDAAKILASLDDSSRELFYQLVDDLRTSDDQDILENLWRVDYIKTPPSVADFVDDPYWLGEVTKPSEENQGIFPIWRKILTSDFDLDSKVHNVVVTGSLGIGKTWISIILLLYRITLAKLLRNPQNFFGMSKGAQIYFTVLSVTREQVGTTAFGDAINFMSYSPFFIEECGFDPEMTYSKQLIPLGNSISINGGSKGWHFIGKNVMGILFDEGNFRLESDPNLKAYQLFNEARQRFKSRFQKKSTYLPAISILSSSAADESSFTESVIKEIMEQNDPNQKVYRSSVYKARSHMLEDLDKDRWFRVSYGLRNVEPMVLRGWYNADGKPIGDEQHEEPAPGCSVEYVPERFLVDYRRDTRGCVQSISGISVGGTHRLFPSTLDIEICIDLAAKDGLVNPCKVDMIPLSMDDERNIWDYLDHNKFLTLHRSQIIPRRHPDMLRFCHIDLATENMAGLSICHLIGNQLVTGMTQEGMPFSQYRLVAEYDFILTIIRGPRKLISIGKIFNFIFWLRDKCGFHFGLVTADQWQSVMPLETLESAGFKVGNVSLDRTSTPYHEWRRAFNEHRIRCYRQHQMIREAENLLDFGDKVEKPEGGSKDTTDSAAGAYFNAVSEAPEGAKQTTSAPPSVFGEGTIAAQESEKPLMEIPVSIQYPKDERVHVI